MFSSSSVNAVLLILSAVVHPLVAQGAPTNATLRFDNPLVTFSPGWRVATFPETGEQFAFAEGLEERVQVTLPPQTTAVFYQGFKISGGGLYLACVDCDANGLSQEVTTVDAHDSKEDGTQPPETLFSILHLDPTRQHVLSVINLQDDRFNHTSQITFDSVVVTTGTDYDGANSTSSSSESAIIVHGLPTGVGTIADVPSATSTSTQASVTATDGSTFTASSTSTASGSQTLGSTGAPTISTSIAQPENTDITTSEGQTATAPSSTLTGTVSHVNDPPAFPSLTSESEAGSAAPTSTSTGGSSTSVPSAISGGNTNGIPLPSATSQRDHGHSGTPQPSASPTSPAPIASATGTPTSAADRSRNTGISKPAIIGIAVVASLLVFALLAAVLVMLVRNRRARQNADMEGTAGLMREAAPTAVDISAPLSLIPPRPRNPFADTVPPDTPLDAPDASTESLDAMLRQPQPSGAPSLPPIPPKSPLRGNFSASSPWLTRIPRDPSPTSPS